MPERRIALVAALLLAVACAGPEGAPTAPLAPPLDTDAGPGGPGVPLPVIVEAGRRRPAGAELPLLNQVEEPLRLERRRIGEPGAARVAELRTYHYQGLSFTVYVAATGHELLQRVEVTGRDYRAPDGLRVGMTREAVVGIRGQPDRTVDGTDVYELGGELPAQLRVSYAPDDTVRRMAWVFPVE